MTNYEWLEEHDKVDEFLQAIYEHRDIDYFKQRYHIRFSHYETFISNLTLWLYDERPEPESYISRQAVLALLDGSFYTLSAAGELDTDAFEKRLNKIKELPTKEIEEDD